MAQSFDEWFDAGGYAASVSEETIREELNRAAGLDQRGPRIWRPQIGKQIIRIVQFPYVEDGERKVDWCSVMHTHPAHVESDNPKVTWLQRRSFIHEDESLDSKMRAKYGRQFAVPCVSKMFGEKCPICEAKFEIGRKYKETTEEGWGHPDLKKWGLWVETDIWGWVIVEQDAGAYFETQEGKRWRRDERKKLKAGKKGAVALKRFNERIGKAEEDAEYFEGLREDGPTIIPAQFGAQLHRSLEQYVRLPEYGGEIASWVSGYRIEVTQTYNPDNAIPSQPTIRMLDRGPIVALDNGEPDMAAIKEALAPVLEADLRGLRYVLSNHPELDQAVQRRVEQIKELAEGGDPGSGAEFANDLPDKLGGSRYSNPLDDDDEYDDVSDEAEEDDDEIEEAAPAAKDVEPFDDFDDDGDDDEEEEEDDEPGAVDVGEDEDVDIAVNAFLAGEKKALRTALRTMTRDQLSTVCSRIGIEPESDDKKAMMKQIANTTPSAPKVDDDEPIEPTEDYGDGDKPLCYKRGAHDPDNDICQFCPFETQCGGDL